MTLYALILFSHVAGAFFLFAGLTLEWLSVQGRYRQNFHGFSEPFARPSAACFRASAGSFSESSFSW